MLKRPLITEKTMALAKDGLYTFELLGDVTKLQIAKLVADKFKVEVISVKTITTPSKRKLQRNRRGYYTTQSSRKALVQVKKGQKIAIFEQAQPEKEATVTTGEGERIATIKEKKSLLRGTKVRVEKVERGENVAETQRNKKTRQQTGKTKGEK